MLFQYNTDRIVLRLLDESCSREVLDFYLKGDSYFGAMEPDRIEGFYTEDYQRRVLKYETECFMAEKCARYYIYEYGGREIIGTVALRNVEGKFFVRNDRVQASAGVYRLWDSY